MPKRILVAGASGATGQLIVARLLRDGHTVTALARNPERAHVPHDRLTFARVDLEKDDGAFERVLAGHDVVISLLGKGLKFRAGGLLATATPVIVGAMKKQGVRRLLYVSAFGVPGSPFKAPVMTQFFFTTFLAGIYADKAMGERAVRASALDYTIFAPVRMNYSTRTGSYRMAEEWPLSGPWVMTRADFADAVVDSMDDPSTVGKRLVVGPAA